MLQLPEHEQRHHQNRNRQRKPGETFGLAIGGFLLIFLRPHNWQMLHGSFPPAGTLLFAQDSAFTRQQDKQEKHGRGAAGSLRTQS